MTSRRIAGTRVLSLMAASIVLGSLLFAVPATASDGETVDTPDMAQFFADHFEIEHRAELSRGTVDAPYMAQFIDDHFRIEHRAELSRGTVDAPYMAQFIDDHFRIEHRAELDIPAGVES